MYLKPLARVPVCLLGLITITATGPPTCAGVVATIDLLLATTTVVAAGTPPNVTVAPGTKFAPEIVTVVPPLVEPVFGVTPLTVGGGDKAGGGAAGAA
jgi:hypothetical protein